MTCTQIKNLIPLYAGGDLPVEQTELVIKHIGVCKLCHNLAVEFEESRNWLREFPSPMFDEVTFDNLRHAVHREIAQSRSRSPLFDWMGLVWNPRFIIPALITLVIFIIGIGVFNSQQQKHGNLTPSVSITDKTKSPSVENERGHIVMSVDKGHLANGSGRSRSPYRSGSSKLVALRIQKAPEPIPLADPEMIALNPEMPERKTDQEMLRIEIQTADPNIRIIWFAPKTDSSPDKLFNDNK